MNIAFFILIFFAVIMFMCGAIIMHFENKKRNKCSYEVIGTSKSLLRSHSPVQHNGIGSQYYTRVYEYQYYGYDKKMLDDYENRIKEGSL